MNNTAHNSLSAALQMFDQAADLLDLDQATRELLRQPLREYQFSIPVRMDNGSTHVFRGFRVQHNDARGPIKGGIRFHPQETIDTVRAMAMNLSWKTAVADLPLGGGKGGVVCDPHNLSIGEQERLCRGWVRQMYRNMGPEIDIPAPDLMTNAQHMLWMLDEYEILAGGRFPGAFTGKPVKMGGSLGRAEATGYGLMITVREALKELNIRPDATTASVQGLGHVARHAIDLYQQMGGKVTCVSSWSHQDGKGFSYRKKEGVNLQELIDITDNFGGIHRQKAADCGYEVLDADAWLAQEVDILIPAAMENQITEENTNLICNSVRLIAEGANGPTTPKAADIIIEKEIFTIPDFLANAGGVTTSYFEQVQSNQNLYWEKEEVLSKLDLKMTSAYIQVSDFARQNDIGMRKAALAIGIDKVARACHDRGWV